ncbi:hypothetical protein OPV22_034871 [Ensete ventricosum]|uniref:Uncharacterized protein n=1 Tax=Ensete ventricosum TaxID=4639 RepID=A0AAV8PJE7_ENSVE|nr:hypothetical protein OPV22_034871 [Ensete ventricosum]
MIPKPAAVPPPVVVATLPPPLILNEEGHGRSTFIAPDEAVIHIRRFRPNGPLSFSLRKSPSGRLARLPSSIRLIGEGSLLRLESPSPLEWQEGKPDFGDI